MIAKSFGLSLVAFLILDFIWLGFVMKDFNMRALAEIGRFKNDTFDVLYIPALLAYMFMSLAVAFFVMPRLGAEASLLQAFLWGAVMGLIVYGVFDMTNMAILKSYPLHFVLADMAWGCFVFGAVTALNQQVLK